MVPPKQLDPTEQDALVKQIGLALLRAAPDDWDRVIVDYRAVGRYAEADGEIVYSDDEISDWPVPPEISALFAQLRAGMYRDGRGTWFNATYRLDHPSSYNLDYDRDEPDWRQPPPPQAYADDLQAFPRTADNIPEWLRRRVSNQPAEPPGPRFRVARIFDGQAGNGRPLVNRPAIPEGDRAPLLEYLNAAPVVSSSRGLDIDRLDPDGRPMVPVAFHTDGTWIWPAAVNYYLHTYGIAPEHELLDHIRRQSFHVPVVDEPTRTAAAGFLGRPAGPGAPVAPVRPPVPANPPLRRPAGGAPRPPGDGAPFPIGNGSPRLAGDGPPRSPAAGPPHPLGDGPPGLPGLPGDDSPFPLADGPPRLPGEGPPFPFGDGPPRPPGDGPPFPVGDGPPRLPGDGPSFPLADGPPRLPGDGPPFPFGDGSPHPPGEGSPRPFGSRHLPGDGSPRRPGEDPPHPYGDGTPRQPGDAPPFPYGDGPPPFADGSPRRPGEDPPQPYGDGTSRQPAPSGDGTSRLPNEDAPHPFGDGSPRQPGEGPPFPFGDGSPVPADAAPHPTGDGPPWRSDTGSPTAPGEGSPGLGGPGSGRRPGDGSVRPLADGSPRLPGDGPAFPFGEGSPRAGASGPRLPDAGPVRRRGDGPPRAAGGSTRMAPGAREPARQAGPPPAALPSQGPPAMTIDALRSQLTKLGVPESAYRIGSVAERAWTMDQTPDGWRVGWYEKEFVAPAMFEDVADAAAFMLGKIMMDAGRRAAPEPPPEPILVPVPAALAEPVDPETVRADPVAARGADPQPTAAVRVEARPAEPEARRSAQPAQRWPIQPMSGEPPLTLFRGKRMIELAPGTEIDRFGNADGNLTYAAGTPFTERSLVPDWIERPYHAYRVERPTQALSGEAIPWFEQAGGGTAYILPDAVEDLLADGRLTELPGRKPPTG